ncbi:hypothetical protein M0R04_06640 [Candidatus Dojkabacteria bacterium]|jgi:hypothetical protein|nr:hypothetical protein [Candidatus Dojkabacteria bacterium]
MVKDKLKFIVRKYIFARSAKEAIRLDKQTPVADVWVDADWQNQQENKFGPMGFNINIPSNHRKERK